MIQPLVVFIAVIIIFEAAHQHDAARVPVSKQSDRLVRPLLQIAEADDVAKRLDGIEDAVGAGIRLDQPVHFEVFIHPKRVERCCVETRQEHIDHDQKVDVLILHAKGYVFIVIGEFFRRRIVIGAEILVIRSDRPFQKIAGRSIQTGSAVGILLPEQAIRLALIGRKTVNGSDLDGFFGMCRHLLLELGIIQLCRLDRGDRKDGIKPLDVRLIADLLDVAAVFRVRHFAHVDELSKRIRPFVALGLLVEVVEDILHHLFDTLGRKIRPFPVDIPHLFIIDLGLFLHRLDIIDAERQHVFIVDGIDDGIGVQLFPERLRRRAQRRALRNARIYGKDGRARKPE